MKILIGVCFFASIHTFSISQLDTLNDGRINIIDGIYIKENILKRTECFIDFAATDEWVLAKRVWRSVHNDQLKNKLFFTQVLYDKNSDSLCLWDVISMYVKSADFTVYQRSHPYADSIDDGDQFKYTIAVRENGNFYTDTVYAKELIENELICREESGQLTPINSRIPPYSDSIFDDNGSLRVAYEPRKMIWYSSKDIVSYHLLEDWYFCEERSILDVKIIGIAPVVSKESADGAFSSESFWLYYPQCEQIFKEYPLVPSEKHHFINLSDFFLKRAFVSSIYKESNVFDCKIDSYRMGVDALMESEKITEEIRTLEHDVWHF